MSTANAGGVQDPALSVADASTFETAAIPWLVIGMGSMAYGKERRGVTALKYMPRIKPYFLTSQWEDGSVSALLRENGFDFTPVTIGYLGRARPTWTLVNLWHMPKLLWKVLAAYRARRCRGVLVLALLPFANVLPALLTLKFFYRAPHVFYLGDIPADTGPNRALCRVADWVADAIIVNSQAVKRGLENFGIASERVEVVYNGLILDRFRNAQPFAWREQFGWEKDAHVVGYAGQFAPNKGVSDFLRAAELVLKETDSCRFVLVGQRDDENACYCQLVERISQKNLGDKIVFAGWTTTMERAYAAMNLIVVPSRHEEPASNVIIEAMASGLPVIATRTGGSPELVSDGTTGCLVEKQNPEEIAGKILLLINDRSLREQLSQSARKETRHRFDAARNASQVEKVILATLK